MSREMLRQKEGFPSNVFEIIPQGVEGQIMTETPTGPGFDDDDSINKLDKNTLDPQEILGKVTLQNDLVQIAGTMVAPAFEVSGASIRLSQRLTLSAFGNFQRTRDEVVGDDHLNFSIPITDAGTGIPQIPVVGPYFQVPAQHDDSELFTGQAINLPGFVGTVDAITTTLTLRFSVPGVLIRIRTFTDTGIDLYGTSEDPYFRFLSEVGDTVIHYPSPIPTNIGVKYFINYDTDDGVSPLNMYGLEVAPGVFSPYFIPGIQLSSMAEYDKEDSFAKNSAFNKNFGSSFGTVTEGNDPRLSDPRTPNPHAASHVNGADDIQSATASQKGLATPTQITKLNGIAPLAQVNTLNDGDYNEDDTESTTVSTTFVNKLSHILNVAVAGDYFIQWHFALANSNADKVSEVQVTLEGTQIGVCETSAKPANIYSCVSGFKRSSLAVGAHTINIDYRAVNNTAKIKAARLQIFKMP